MDKKYIKNVLIYVLSGVLSLLGIGYIVFHLADGGAVGISTETAVLVKTEQRVPGQALIFRDEVAIEAVGDDACSIVKDGEKVMAGTEVLQIFRSEQRVSDRILQIEKQIAILEDSLNANGIPTAHSSNEKQLQELYYAMLNGVHGGSLANTEELSVRLQTYINRRKHSSVTEKAIKESIGNLEKQKTALLAMYADSTELHTAPATGLYYKGSDGFEGLCTLEAAKQMDYTAFLQIRQSVFQAEESQNGAGRVATDSYWYIAMTLDKETARNLKVGAKYPICFDENGNRTVYMTLERMDSKYKQTDCLLVFGCRSVPQDFDFKRVQQVTLISETVEGIHVPISAVRYVDGKVGVYVTEGNKVVFRRIDILVLKEGYYTVKQHDTSSLEYADMIRLHDKIILTGKGLYHGKYLN